jgi:hypothetical protein
LRGVFREDIGYARCHGQAIGKSVFTLNIKSHVCALSDFLKKTTDASVTGVEHPLVHETDRTRAFRKHPRLCASVVCCRAKKDKYGKGEDNSRKGLAALTPPTCKRRRTQAVYPELFFDL